MGAGESRLEKQLQSSDSPDSEHYAGLENFGNTCYANSVLQALYFCLPFRLAVQSWLTQKELQLQVNGGEKVKKEKSWINTAFGTGGLSKEEAGETPLLYAFSKLFEEITLQKRKVGIVRPSSFISTLKKENEIFRSLMQQDAHEFLMFCLNNISESLEKEAKAAKTKNGELPSPNGLSNGIANRHDKDNDKSNAAISHTQNPSNGEVNQEKQETLVESIFQGSISNETQCLTCENVTHRDESFLDVQVVIEANCSISHCLNRLGKIEKMADQNKFFCECCGSLQEANKCTRFKKLPKILILHLKRFKYLERLERHTKLSHRVSFPFELRIPTSSTSRPNQSSKTNLSSNLEIHHSIMSQSKQLETPLSNQSPRQNQDLHHSQQSQQSPPSITKSNSASLNSSTLFQDDNTDPLYYLLAVVVHCGASANSGHYVALIRSRDRWLKFDDDKVDPIDDPTQFMEKVFGNWNHNPEQTQYSNAGYILFYERRSEHGSMKPQVQVS